MYVSDAALGPSARLSRLLVSSSSELEPNQGRIQEFALRGPDNLLTSPFPSRLFPSRLFPSLPSFPSLPFP